MQERSKTRFFPAESLQFVPSVRILGFGLTTYKLGPSSALLSPTFFGEGSPTKIKNRVPLFESLYLEDLGKDPVGIADLLADLANRVAGLFASP